MKKPATAGPIKIVINQSKGVAKVVSNSGAEKEGKEPPPQQQRSDSASPSASEPQGPLPLEPQVVLEEGGRAVAQWKKRRESHKEKAKEPTEAEGTEPTTTTTTTRGGRRLIREKSSLPRDFGLAHDHDKSLPPDAAAVPDLEYKCMECVKSFATSNDLLAHLVRHRPSDRPPSSAVKCALCQVGQSGFQSESS